MKGMTHLQKVASKVNWLCGFRLQRINYDRELEEVLSRHTNNLILRHNRQLEEIERNIKLDYKRYAAAYKLEQKTS